MSVFLMNVGITRVTENIGMSFEMAIILVAFLAGLVFYAKSFPLGNMIQFIMFAGIFAWFYHAGYNWTIPAIAAMVMIVLMALTLIPVSSVAQKGGII